MRTVCAYLLLVALVAGPVAAREQSPPLSAEDLIRQGVALHDQGKFDDAVRRYQQALEREPENAVALYELANTYSALQLYDRCDEVALRGLKKPGALEGALFTAQGTCLSSAGKTAEAVRVFEQGLAKHPDDPDLHFNLAVTLWHEGQLEPAAQHLQKALAVRPSHSTPYYALGAITAAKGRRSEGIFYYLRFVSLERESKRAAEASTQVFELLNSGVSADGDKDVRITLGGDFGKAGDDQASLELMRTLTAATAHLDDARDQSPAQRSVAALDQFLKIAGEDTKLSQTFAGQKAVAPILQLEQRGVLECFEYLVAARAQLQGAEDWLAKHPEALRKLETALAELGQ